MSINRLSKISNRRCQTVTSDAPGGSYDVNRFIRWYLHVPIANSSQHLLQFSWENRFYRFRALPFGLSSAPWVFTKILRPVVEHCRSCGIRLMAYLDDFIV